MDPALHQYELVIKNELLNFANLKQADHRYDFNI